MMKNQFGSCIKRKAFLLAVAVVSMVSPLAAARNLVLLSAPGSGKGTLSQYLVKEHGYYQICPGDLFRDEIKLQTALGKRIQGIVNAGQYVDEETTCELVLSHLQHALSEGKNFIVDGFPRTDYAFDVLNQFLHARGLVDDTHFVQFLARDEVCLKRILSRLVCTTCFRVYNTVVAKPLHNDVCDNCGACLSARKADNEKIAKERIAYFHSHIEPHLTKAERFYQVVTLDGEKSRDLLEQDYQLLVGDQ